MNISTLKATIKDLVISGKGILAADESQNTIKKRFDSINIEDTEENRRAYREMLLTTPNLSNYIAGVILFEETLYQKTKEGLTFPEFLSKNGIVPGIKVDKGPVALENFTGEKVTQGLDGLPDRLVEYKKVGARFAKWRAIYNITDTLPSSTLIKTNATLLARYAAICQSQDIVPIVEPEVLIDGNHTLERCLEVTEKVFHQVFHALHQYKVSLELMILKPSMVISGKEASSQSSVEEVATETIKVLRRTVPAAVPSINFLSGGQTEKQATAHLNAINKQGPLPWYVSFSYARALQGPALTAWAGKSSNVEQAQKIFIKRAQLNGAATKGEYDEKMEQQ